MPTANPMMMTAIVSNLTSTTYVVTVSPPALDPFLNLHSHEHECRDGQGCRQLSEA